MRLASLFLISLPLVQAQLDTNTQAVAALINKTIAAQSVNFKSLMLKYSKLPSTPSTYMTCNPAALSINSAVPYNYSMSCQLAAQPKSTVTIFMEAYGIKFSACYLQFDATSWSTPQSFEVLPRSSLFKVDVAGTAIYMQAYTATEAYKKSIFTIPLSINTRAAGSCSVTFDGQITTFQLTPIPLKFYGTKGYTIIESTAGLRVMGKWSSRSTLAGVIVQYNQAEYLISYSTVIGNPPIAYANAGTSDSGTEKTIVITLKDSTIIAVTVVAISDQTNQKAFALSVDIELSPLHYQKIGGLCGPWDDSLDPTKLLCNANSWTRTQSGTTSDDNTQSFGNCWESVILKRKPLVGSDLGLTTTTRTFCMIPSLSSKKAVKSPLLNLPVSQGDAPSDGEQFLEDSKATDGVNSVDEFQDTPLEPASHVMSVSSTVSPLGDSKQCATSFDDDCVSTHAYTKQIVSTAFVQSLDGFPGVFASASGDHTVKPASSGALTGNKGFSNATSQSSNANSSTADLKNTTSTIAVIAQSSSQMLVTSILLFVIGLVFFY